MYKSAIIQSWRYKPAVTNLQGVTRGHPIYFRFLHHFHLFFSFPRRTTQIRPSRASRASQTSQNCTVDCTVNAQSMRSNAQSVHSRCAAMHSCTVNAQFSIQFLGGTQTGHVELLNLILVHVYKERLNSRALQSSVSSYNNSKGFSPLY